MDDKIVAAAKEIVEKIKLLPNDTEFVLGKYFAEYEFDLMSNFTLMQEVLELCKKNNIKIVNIQKNKTLGMPWVYIYKKVISK